VKPAPFAYQRPTTEAAVLDLLARHGAQAKVLAGGQSLMPMLALRLVRPELVIDLGGLEGADRLEVTGGQLEIGPLVRHQQVVDSALARTEVPALAEAAGWIGHLEIRNRGTVLGSLAHADPAAELPAVAVALGAQMICHSQAGERIVPAGEFFLGLFQTALAEGEMLVSCRLPLGAVARASAFTEFALREGDFALAAVAASLVTGPDGRVAEVRLALAGMGPAPVTNETAQAQLVGQIPSPAVLREFADAVLSQAEPADDLRATASYRLKLASRLIVEALGESISRNPKGGVSRA